MTFEEAVEANAAGDISAFRRLMIAGVFLYGALGLAGLIALALVVGDKTAALVAIAACGAAYVAQHAGAMAEVPGARRINMASTILSVALAVIAFFLLLAR